MKTRDIEDDDPEPVTAPEALRRLAEARIERERAAKVYAGPSLEWTGPQSREVAAGLEEKWKTCRRVG